MKTILIVDDETNSRNGLKRFLEQEYKVFTAQDAYEGKEILKQNSCDIVLTDVKMPKQDGISFIKEVKDLYPSCHFVVMTAYGSIKSAVEALKVGAYDFIQKPIDIDDLLKRLHGVKQEKKRTKTTTKTKEKTQPNIIGKDPIFLKILQQVTQIAPTRATVLLSGESGTGKEVIAKKIHEESNRADGPFIAVHCAALNENLLESELFGHEKGSFTNALNQKIGRFEAANNGTLFLDEIGEISPSIQVKLLRALETRSIERVGGLQNIDIDTRIITATNKNLFEMTKNGSFREDLYYRLDVINIELPSLNKRKQDIPLLLDFFLQQNNQENNTNKRFNQESLNALCNYSWPGNIRELKNIVERVSILAPKNIIQIQDLPTKIITPTL